MPQEGARRAGNFTAQGFDIPGPLAISARRFADARGVFAETYSRADFAALGVAEEFVQDNHSLSTAAGTLRGLHFQRPPRAQAKLVRVTRGAVLDVVVDLRRASPHFGRHIALELSAENGLIFYVPVGFAHGFATTAPETEVIYKVSDTYAPDADAGIAWDDPALGIAWGVAAPILSEKDRNLPRLAELPAIF
jgi:dTDP-4-dehydrorhamnose 3,5-epimerase